MKIATVITVVVTLCITINFVNGQLPYLVGYIDKINQWWPPSAIATGLGIPGYAPATAYNHILLSFWTTGGAVDTALLWQNASYYCSSQNPWGNTTAQIQAAWVNLYHGAGIKILVSAFGSTDFPTSQGVDPVACGNQLAQFVIDNQLDGVDLDWEDNDAMNAGKGEAWLIAITQTLRQKLPNSKGYIITHAPQAPYFTGKSVYPNGGYLTVDAVVGNLINFYNVQFYNQGTSMYETYATLFQTSDGWAANTAVFQIAQNVNISRIVVGKPVTTGDVNNSGYVPVTQLAQYLALGVQAGWHTGVMGWQYPDDTNGNWIKTLSQSF